MKNTFKYIIASVVFSAAAMMSGFTTSAQNMTVPYKVENGIAYKKSVSQTPNENGEYIVTLETFVTGEVSTKQKPIPADIVLLLDVSGSMEDPYPGQQNEYIPIDQNWAYNTVSYGTGNNARYYFYEGDYRRVQRNYYYNSNTDWGVYLYFNVGNQTYYLNGSGIGERPSRIQDGNTTIYSGVLYRYGTPYANRLEALQDAVKKFVDVVKSKNEELKLKEGQVGNRIAIVKFAGDTTSTGGITEGNNHYRDGSYTYNRTEVYKQFKEVATEAESLKSSVDQLDAAGATSVDYGLSKVKQLINQLSLPITDEDGNTVRSRTVVVFTDGNPTHSSGFERSVAVAAVNTGKTIKTKLDATIFTVGVFGTDKDSQTDAYMEHLSSNYPDASAAVGNNRINYTGEPLPLVDDRVYSIIVGDDKGLDEVFESIAAQSSGQNTSVGDDSVTTLDVVSSSFKLPDSVTREQIHVYTAQCIGLAVDEDGNPWYDEEGNQYLAFADPIEAKNRPKVDVLWVRRPELDGDGNPIIEDGKIKYKWEKLGGDDGYDIDQNISFEYTQGSSDNSVSVKGFNYSDYWCGLDEDHENTEQYNSEDYPDTYKPHYRGFKLILEFPIVVQEDAVGGPQVETNDEKSGIYMTDEEGHISGDPLVVFNRPDVKLPVQIWIQKNGLQGEDSAVFTLARAPFSENFNPETAKWESVTKIVVGPDDYDPATGVYLKKQVGLSPDYFYRIKEDAWAFGYQYQYGGILYTVGEEVHNPFVFDNTPKNKKFDEAQARNIFSEKKSSATE